MAVLSTKPYTKAELGVIIAKFNAIVSRVSAANAALADSKSVWSFSTDASTAMTLAQGNMNRVLADSEYAIKAGSYNGRLLNPQDLNELMTRLASAIKPLSDAITAYNAAAPTAKLKGLAQDLTNLVTDTLSFVAGAPSKFRTIVMWGAIGVAAVFILPPLLRTILAFRKGGANAALEEGTRALESGRSAVTSAAKKGAELTARAGAAYASGGASERLLAAKNAVSGMRRRRVTRRRSR